jgi:hypothetical protein
MHKLLIVLVAVVAVCALGGTGGASGLFVAGLSGDEEVPAVQTDTTGRARVVFNTDDTAAEFQLQVRRGERITQAHIHCAPLGVNGPIVVFLAGLNSQGYNVDGIFPWVSNATFTDTSVIPPTNPACPHTINNLADLILAIRAGNTYVNVHSVDHSSGVVRGQLVEVAP